MSVNKVMLLGNLGKDPELRFTQQQMPICTFSIATGERRKDQSGNWTEHTEWHNIVVFGKTAENCAQYLKKGRQAFIEGRIQTRKWQDKEGKDRYTTEIIASTVQFIGGRAGESSGAMSSSSEEGSIPSPSVAREPEVAVAANGGATPAAVSFDDDDIPF